MTNADLLVRVDATTVAFDSAMSRASKATLNLEKSLGTASKAQENMNRALASASGSADAAVAAQTKYDAALTNVAAAQDRVALSSKKAAESEAAASRAATGLEKALAAAAIAQGDLDKALASGSGSADAAVVAQGRYDAALNQVAVAQDRVALSTKKAAESEAAAAMAAAGLEKAVGSAAIAQADLDKAQTSAAGSADAAVASQGRYDAALNSVVASQDRVALSSKRAAESEAASSAKAAAAAEASASKQAAAQATAAKAFGAVGLAAVAAFGLSVKAAAEFDSKMAQVQSLLKGTPTEMAGLRGAAFQFSNLGISASDAADAETELVKAGVGVHDILSGGLKGTLALAAAGQMDVGSATTIAVNAMTQFQLTGKDIPHVADLIAAGADKSLASVQGLGSGLSQVGTSANQLGVPLQDTVGVLSQLSQSGLDAEKGGTALKQMFLKLEAPSLKASGLMDDYGISLYNAKGQFAGMTNLAGQLQKGLAKLTPEQRNSALATIFGSRAIQAANVLYRDGAKATGQWISSVNQQGFAMQQARGKMDSLSGDLSKLKAGFSNLAVSMGESSQGPLRSLVQGVTSLVDGLAHLSPAMKSTITSTLGFIAVAGTGAYAISKISGSLKTMQMNMMATGNTSASSARKMIAVKGAALAVGIGLEALGSHLGQTNRGLGDVVSAAGDVATGFAMGGLFGAALGGAIGLIKTFYDQSQQQQQLISGVAATLNQETGALTKNTDAFIANKLASDGTAANLTSLGISTNEWVKAVTKGGPTLSMLTSRLKGVEAAGKSINAGHGFYYTESAKQAQNLLGTLSNYIAGLKAARRETINNYDSNEALKQSYIQTRPAAQHMGQAIDEFGQQAGQGATAAGHLSSGMDGVKTATDKANAAIQKNLDALGKDVIAFNKVAAAMLQDRHDRYAMITATDTFTAATNKLANATNKSTQTLNAHTKAGQKNETTMETFINQWNNSTAAAQAAPGAYEKARRGLLTFLATVGVSTAKAKQMADTFLAIKDPANTAHLTTQQAEFYARVLGGKYQAVPDPKNKAALDPAAATGAAAGLSRDYQAVPDPNNKASLDTKAATGASAGLSHNLNALGAMHPVPTADLNNDPATTAANNTADQLNRVGQMHPVPTADLNNDPATAAANNTADQLNKVGQMRPVATIGVDIRNAIAGLNIFKSSANTALAGISDEAVKVTLSAQSSKVMNQLGMARGGPVRGGTSGRDSVPALLMPDEHVLTTADVARMGGHAGVLAMRSMFAHGQTNRFAAGGAVTLSPSVQSTGLGSAVGGVQSLFNGVLNQLDHALSKKANSATSGLTTGASGGSFAGLVGGSGVARWAPVILQALNLLHQPPSWLKAAEYRMNVESGGNPTIVNRYDSNWVAGTPSVGLMQVIGPTFRSYAGPFRNRGPFEYGTSVDPLANVYAGMNYALHAYGVPIVGGTQGYDGGGMLGPGQAGVNHTGHPEPVFTHDQWQVLQRAIQFEPHLADRVNRLVDAMHAASQAKHPKARTDAVQAKIVSLVSSAGQDIRAHAKQSRQDRRAALQARTQATRQAEKAHDQAMRGMDKMLKHFGVDGKMTVGDTRTQLQTMFKAVRDVVGRGSPLLDRLGRLGDRLLDVQRSQDKAVAALGRQTAKLDQMRQARDAYAKTVSSAYRHDPFAFDNTAQFTLQLRADRNDAQTAQRELTTLRHRGLSGALLKQLQASGNTALIGQLSHSSPAEIKHYERLFASTNKALGHLGRSSAQSVYGREIHQQVQVVHHLDRTIRNLDHRLGQLEHAVERGARRGTSDGHRHQDHHNRTQRKARR